MLRRRLCVLRFAPLVLICFFCCTPLPGAAAPPAVPQVLARFDGFSGRVEYSGRRTDAPRAPEVHGSAIIGDDGFTLDERAPRYALHADDAVTVVRAGALQARTGVLDSDALVNAWMVAVAALAHGGLVSRGRGAWQTGAGIIIYMDTDGESITGMNAGQGGQLAFTFSQWTDIGGLAIPKRILRLRHGIADATFQIDRLDIVRDPTGTTGRRISEQSSSAAAMARSQSSSAPAAAPATPPFPARLMFTLFGFLLLGIALVAWFRRDAFAQSLCRRCANDPRAWRRAQSAAYVDASGLLHFEGNAYRVGPEFFARSVEVGCSALFVRISAPGVSRAVVLPRRLPRISAVRRPGRRRAAAHGLSLIEILIATGFFTVVIVGAIYPALIATAHADFVAAQKRAALSAALNALTDEEAACAYGQVVPTGTITTTNNGITVVVTLTNSSVVGARDIAVTASDASGQVLARLATTVGPPVPPPGLGGPPTGGPPQTGPPVRETQPPSSPTGSPATPTPLPVFGSGGG